MVSLLLDRKQKSSVAISCPRRKAHNDRWFVEEFLGYEVWDTLQVLGSNRRFLLASGIVTEGEDPRGLRKPP
jgi:hypothetical protein